MLVQSLILLFYMTLTGIAGFAIMWTLVKHDFFLPHFLRFISSDRFKTIFSVRNLAVACLLCIGISVAIWIAPWHRLAPTPPVTAPQPQFTLTDMVHNIGWVAISVVIILLVMSVYSVAIMVERYMTYTAARKHSLEFEPLVAQALRQDRIEEAIDIGERHPESPLANVVSSGLQEFRGHEEISVDEVEASKRVLREAIARKEAELRRGLSALVTIGSVAPFVGLFGTVFGIINAFRDANKAEVTGIGAVAGGISEALFTTALGLIVAFPAVWLFNYFTGKIDGFVIEMDNSASELMDDFTKKHVAHSTQKS